MRLTLLALLAVVAAAQDTLDKDWIAKDIAIARRVAEALPPGEAPVAEVVKRLEPNETEEDRDIGFGARRLRLAFYGGYTETRITIVVWKDRAEPVDLTCETDRPETWAEVRDGVESAYRPLDPKSGPRGLQVRIGHQAGPDGFREARTKALGPPLGVDPHPDLAKEYLWLWSPFSDVTYGTTAGFAGEPLRGRTAIEKILAHRHGKPLLEDLLACPNPESRVYAAEAWLRLERKGEKLAERVRKGIAWVRESDVEIHVARGCVMSWEPAQGILTEILAATKR